MNQFEYKNINKNKRRDKTMLASVFLGITGMIGKSIATATL